MNRALSSVTSLAIALSFESDTSTVLAEAIASITDIPSSSISPVCTNRSASEYNFESTSSLTASILALMFKVRASLLSSFSLGPVPTIFSSTDSLNLDLAIARSSNACCFSFARRPTDKILYKPPSVFFSVITSR